MKYDVISDGKSVLVNSQDGCCVGRFERDGVEVLINTDHIYDLKLGPTTRSDWDKFRTCMMINHDVYVETYHRPWYLGSTPI